MDNINLTEKPINISTFSPAYRRHCNDLYSILLIREHYDSCLFYNLCKTCELSLADVPSTVVFNPVKNFNTGIFSKITNVTDFRLPTQEVFVHFLRKLKKTNEIQEQPIVVSSVIDEVRNKQPFFCNFWMEKKFGDSIIHTTGYREMVLKVRPSNEDFFPIICFRHCNKTSN